MKLKKVKLIIFSLVGLSLLIVLSFNLSLKLINNTSEFSQKVKYFSTIFERFIKKTIYKAII